MDPEWFQAIVHLFEKPFRTRNSNSLDLSLSVACLLLVPSFFA